LEQICSWAREANDREFTERVADRFPQMLLFRGTTIPSDVACVCHVMRAAKRALQQIKVRTRFVGDSLQRMMTEISESTKVRR